MMAAADRTLAALLPAPLEEAALDLFGYIEVVCNRAGIHSALGYLSPAEFEKADWPAEDSRPKAAKRVAMASG